MATVDAVLSAVSLGLQLILDHAKKAEDDKKKAHDAVKNLPVPDPPKGGPSGS